MFGNRWRVLLSGLFALGIFGMIRPALAANCPDLSGADITISSNCDLPAGSYTYTGTLTIANGVTVNALSDAQSHIGVTITSDNIDIVGTITSNGNGWDGAPGSTPDNGAGSYGGTGAGEYWTPGATYGSITQPDALGSNAAAGGAIKLTANSTLTISGTVSSDGVFNWFHNGSGGSVWLQTSTLAGNGTVSARGSDGYVNGAGGGRVAVYYTTDSSTLLSGNKMTAGGGGGWYNAGAGTLYVKAASAANGDLIIDSVGAGGGVTTQVAQTSDSFDTMKVIRSGNFSIVSGSTLQVGQFTGGNGSGSVTIQSGGTLVSPASGISITGVTVTNNGSISNLTNLTVGSGATYVHGSLNTISATTVTVQSGGIVTHVANATTKTAIVSISATNIDIQSGGSIDVGGKGFQAGAGPGAGAQGAGPGGGYGGIGGSTGGGGTYGSETQPDDLGSGGGYNPGGGQVTLVASNALTVNGSIVADGSNANAYGSGSGGTVNVSTNVLTGNGTITAKGPNCAGGYGGGGGGGRIAIAVTTDQSSLVAGTNILVTGGQSCDGANGGVGTIYFPTPNPVPTLTSLSPTFAGAGGQSFVLTVYGTNFVSTSMVQWNQANLSTTFVSSTQMTAVVPQSNIAQPGTAYITVNSPSPGGGTTDPIAFPINAVPPVVVDTAITSETSNGSQETSLALVAGSTVNLYVHGGVTATNGCASLTYVSVKIHLSDVSADCSPDGNTCASGNASSFTACGQGGTTAQYEVVVPMQYYAEPTDTGSPNAGKQWLATVTVTDQSNNQGSLTDTGFQVQSLNAVDATASINYGALVFGTLSSKESVTFTNKGNRALDATVVSNGPMVCQSGSIPSENTHMSVNANAPYAQMSPVSASTPLSLGLNLAKRTTAGDPTSAAYAQLQMTSGGQNGTCSNILTFTTIVL